jgi:hypothetical protein
VGLGGGVPAAVAERGDGLPVVLSSRSGVDPSEGGGRFGEPGLGLAKPDDLTPHPTVWFQADRSPARGDQGKLVNAPLMPQPVLHGDIGTG